MEAIALNFRGCCRGVKTDLADVQTWRALARGCPRIIYRSDDNKIHDFIFSMFQLGVGDFIYFHPGCFFFVLFCFIIILKYFDNTIKEKCIKLIHYRQHCSLFLCVVLHHTILLVLCERQHH